MSRMFLIPRTILLDLKTASSVLLVFDSGVVAALALSACEQDIDAHVLLQDFRHNAGANGAAAFTDSEALALGHGDGVDELGDERGVVAG